ncbi:hypothetical protein AVEN_196255-1 [Araneus ventricosus]|uniref:Uncharacterized protein n=1 Tax=Araneus ventricosus TaxID=182803 RepID=A0A4Y2I033_ARAVE|nr:hypothetical protein AVEN_196255-1 [Araneus ventricosus]
MRKISTRRKSIIAHHRTYPLELMDIVMNMSCRFPAVLVLWLERDIYRDFMGAGGMGADDLRTWRQNEGSQNLENQ